MVKTDLSYIAWGLQTIWLIMITTNLIMVLPPMFSFITCIVIFIASLSLSSYSLIKRSNILASCGIIFASTLIFLYTMVAYFLPEAGIPAPI